MADTITKIIFRRGLDSTRRIGGGNGVKLNVGEPGYCIDTKRVFIGDGIDANGTIGTIPVTFRNHGKFTSFFGPTTASFSSTVYNALTSGGAEVGDLLFDDNNKVLYYIQTKSALSAVPATSDLARFDLVGRITSHNGVSALRSQEAVSVSLNPNFFTVDAGSGINLLYPSTVGTPSNRVQFTAQGAIVGNSSLTVSDTSSLLKSVTLGQAGVHATLSAYGNIVVSDNSNAFTSPGYSSNSWVNAWSTLNSTSGTWQSTSNSIASITPFAWQWNTAGTHILSTYNSDVRVGINAYPTFQGLTVKGTSTLATALSVNGSIVTTGDCTVFSTSDINLKKNIKPIPHALNAINSLRGVTFDWDETKVTHLSGPDYGVIAQEVEQIFPHMVSTHPDGTKAVNYMKLIPVLIQAVKELSKHVSTLTK